MPEFIYGNWAIVETMRAGRRKVENTPWHPFNGQTERACHLDDLAGRSLLLDTLRQYQLLNLPSPSAHRLDD
ncbi:MAG: hypothetical protein AAF125_02720, partial [Chloroflexota bacterium]